MGEDDERGCMYSEIYYWLRRFAVTLRRCFRRGYFRVLWLIRRVMPLRWFKYFWPNVRHVRNELLNGTARPSRRK